MVCKEQVDLGFLSVCEPLKSCQECPTDLSSFLSFPFGVVLMSMLFEPFFEVASCRLNDMENAVLVPSLRVEHRNSLCIYPQIRDDHLHLFSVKGEGSGMGN